MSELKIQNFKCFDAITIPLKPMTILAGANGNGKSSVIQSLLLLRKMIEDNGQLKNAYYQWKGVTTDAKSFLNQGYLLALGNSGLIINRQFNHDNEIIISVLDESKQLTVNCLANSKIPELFLDISSCNNSLEEHPILAKPFYYLNAERLGPRIRQNIQSALFPHAGFQGEYVAQLISDLNYTRSIDAARMHPHSKGASLEHHINAWLNELMPGVEITAKTSLETMTAQIVVENEYTKGDPTLATNIGFGISYVLPIIATGLIAVKNSYMIVENPEAHLHPSAQSKIGRFLAMIAQTGVHVIVETHSDHVINGIQIAAAKKEINAQSIGIQFFNQPKEAIQPQVESINVNEKGELSKWPKGFFDQTQIDFAELFKLRKRL